MLRKMKKWLSFTNPWVDKRDAEIKKSKAKFRKDGVEFVQLIFPDLHGMASGVTILKERFEIVATVGVDLCLEPQTPRGELVRGIDYFESRGYPNSLLVPDLCTYSLVPWMPQTARFLCRATDGAFKGLASRDIAQKQIERLKEAGFHLYSGYEMEFLLTEKSDAKLSQSGHFMRINRRTPQMDVLYEAVKILKRQNIAVTVIHEECDPQQFEVVLGPSWGIEAADAAFSARFAIKQIAKEHGLTATFMRKFENANECGNAMHYNHSLWHNGHCSFGEDQLSECSQHWLAGLVAHADALCALCSPTLNCPRCFKPGTAAPIAADWDFDNRSVAFRVKGKASKSIYIENRLPSGSANPYLVQAGIIAAGMDGIEKGLKLGPASAGYYRQTMGKQLPQTLEESLKLLALDDVILEAIGRDFAKIFIACKEREIAKAKLQGVDLISNHVSDFERDMYSEAL